MGALDLITEKRCEALPRENGVAEIQGLLEESGLPDLESDVRVAFATDARIWMFRGKVALAPFATSTHPVTAGRPRATSRLVP